MVPVPAEEVQFIEFEMFIQLNRDALLINGDLLIGFILIQTFMLENLLLLNHVAVLILIVD